MLLIPDFGELRIFIFKGYLRGWIAYYRFAQIKRLCIETNEWLGRTRMCIWKSWKNVKTRVSNLKKCGVSCW
ncbi:hypothetical protein H6B13_16445 [Bacteroides gallinaceum]|uniref:group II intron maturase-specific domain-containing protein n=1 Tax=Bacteroides gallinaceum TaxID=1462571 RepID=UPI001958AFE6|nr:group II intron maturase-specific domain-containing protein [Bacteroides gallinaceum]MBM6721203.1 hypothetical protein [Bacteroides gallinaceum]